MHADLSLTSHHGLFRDLRPLPLLIISSAALLVMGIVMISSASMDMRRKPWVTVTTM